MTRQTFAFFQLRFHESSFLGFVSRELGETLALDVQAFFLY